MKKIALFMMIVSVSVISCKKENVAAKLVRETEQSLTGKWYIESIITEAYHPIPSLISTSEYVGGSSDYYWFKQDKEVEISSPSGIQSPGEFLVYNPTQVRIGDNVLNIVTLTPTKLKLVIDRNDVVTDSRTVTSISFGK